MNLDKETAYLVVAIAVALIVFISFPLSSWLQGQGEEQPATTPEDIEFCHSVETQVRNQSNTSLTNFTCYPGTQKYAERLDAPPEVKDMTDLRCLCTFVDANGSRRLLPIWQSGSVSGTKVK